MPAETPAERALVARIAASERWARVEDRTAATAAMRKALTDKFEREADPDGVLSPDERARRAANLRTAFYARLSLKSAQARRARSRAAALEAEVERELDGEAAIA